MNIATLFCQIPLQLTFAGFLLEDESNIQGFFPKEYAEILFYVNLFMKVDIFTAQNHDSDFYFYSIH